MLFEPQVESFTQVQSVFLFSEGYKRICSLEQPCEKQFSEAK